MELSFSGPGCFFPVTLLFLLFSLFILSLARPPVSSSVSVFSRCDIPVPLLLPIHWHTCDSASHPAPVNPGSGLSQIFQLWCWCWCRSQTGGWVEDFPCVCLNPDCLCVNLDPIVLYSPESFHPPALPGDFCSSASQPTAQLTLPALIHHQLYLLSSKPPLKNTAFWAHLLLL